MFKGFSPVFDEESRVLILGSFPSVKSRENGFYYGNKQNRFWKMLEIVFDEKIENSIAFKTQFLLKHKIALYDVVEESDLAGSADSSLEKSNKRIANFEFLLPPYTKVQKILCNGKTAFNLCMQSGHHDMQICCLPSTSSANVRFDIEKWAKELSFLK